MTANTVSDETFEKEVLKSELPVFVDFFAQWCGPCKAMAPALDEVAEELRGKVKIVKVDIDQSPNVTDTYGIRSMPTLVLFKDGKQAALHLGALVQKAKLVEWINGTIGASEPAPPPRVVEFKLTNGMHAVVIAKPGAAAVVHQLLYKAGTKDDPEGRSGTARFLGVLMSKQTEPMGGLDRPSTTPDATCFIQAVRDALSQDVREKLKAAMAKEADRMAGLRLTEEEITAVRQQSAAQLSEAAAPPRAQLNRRMYEAANPAGAPPDRTAELSRDELVRFHERYYAPNNAVLVVAGDVEPDEVKELAEDIYGHIPARPEVTRPTLPALPALPPSRTVERRFTETDGSAKHGMLSRKYVVPSYPRARAGEAEALQVLVAILDRSGPLQRKLVQEDQLATSVKAFYLDFGAGSGEISLSVAQGDGAPEEIEAALDQVLDAIRIKGVSEEELTRAKEVFAAVHRVEGEREWTLAQRYGWAVATGRSIADVNGWPAAVARVTTDDIRKVANTYLDPRNSITGWLVCAPADDRAA